MTDERPAGAAALAYSDALPYYDTQLDTPGMRDAVLREIEAESQQHPFVADEWLFPCPALFANNANMVDELARAERNEKLKVIDTERHQLPLPAGGADASEDAWAAALRNAETQLAHMDVRYVFHLFKVDTGFKILNYFVVMVVRALRGQFNLHSKHMATPQLRPRGDADVGNTIQRRHSRGVGRCQSVSEESANTCR